VLKRCQSNHSLALRAVAAILTLPVLAYVPEPAILSARTQEASVESPELAEAERLHSQALKLYGEGKYDEAISLSERALIIRERRLGRFDLRVAESLHNLGMLYREKGDYVRAEPLYMRALSIRERELAADDMRIASTLSHLGQLNRLKGDYAQAEAQYRRALSIREKTLGDDDPFVATSLSNLALVYVIQRDYAKAEPLYQRALQIDESTVGPEHPHVAAVLNNLGSMYWEQDDYERAEEMVRRSLGIDEKASGPEHPNVAHSLANLATLLSEKGDLARAEQLYQRALSIREKALGPEHPLVASLLSNLSLLFRDKGDAEQAVGLQSRANDIRERNLESILSTGAESQKLSYLAVLAGETDGTVSLHVDFAPQEARAARLALTTVLRRKGRVLDAMSDQIGALRRRLGPADNALLDQLAQARSRLSTLVLRGPGPANPSQYRTEVAEAELQVRDLEAEVSQRSVEFRTQTQPVTFERVQGAIPPGAALVEVVAYRPFNVRAKARAERWGAPRYVAYVLKAEGPPAWVALEGDASSLDREATRLRAALRNPRREDVRELARSVEERLMRPIRKLLGGVRQVLLSPDGALNLLPFAALVDEQGQYLVEQYAFTYLTSGRDLLRMRTRLPNRQEPVVVASPAFDLPRENRATPPGRNPRGVGGHVAAEFKERFESLGETAAEAKEVGRLLSVKPMLETQATEAALKNVRAPKVLHVATHGFFRIDKSRRPLDTMSGAQSGGFTRFVARGESESPLLRSGLALAGANNLDGGAGEDGVLTAFEVSGLDLWGTKLVVLSACETGLGDVQQGEGVYGLRRALVLAGAESQVMSLWKVNDEVTKGFMVAYHERLKAAEGRAEALRNVQLGMLRSKGRSEDHSHPYYWASFLESGEWGRLDGR
jgi:CHAT domain-containing protein/tetratricopeptide (TPR) repeat protein